MFDSSSGKRSFAKLEGDIVAKCLSVFLAGPYLGEDNVSSAPTFLRHHLHNYINEETKHEVILGEHSSLVSAGRSRFSKTGKVAASEILCAKSADAIIIEATNIGAFCELGAWSTNKPLCEKMLVICDKVYEKQPSYFRIGTLALAKANGAKVKWINIKDDKRAKKLTARFLQDMVDKIVISQALEI